MLKMGNIQFEVEGLVFQDCLWYRGHTASQLNASAVEIPTSIFHTNM